MGCRLTEARNFIAAESPPSAAETVTANIEDLKAKPQTPLGAEQLRGRYLMLYNYLYAYNIYCFRYVSVNIIFNDYPFTLVTQKIAGQYIAGQTAKRSKYYTCVYCNGL